MAAAAPVGNDDLFADSVQEIAAADAVRAGEPLATRMRPRTLDEYVGQEHVLGPGKLLRRAIEADRLYSALFYGPPGTGKTSLAEVIARATQAKFERLSGVESTVADIRRVIATAVNRLRVNPRARTILFIDEIHRFNKAQQDALLPDVERGTVRLLGATTENPFFAVNGPLVSRSQIFQLEPLQPADLRRLMAAALLDRERGLGQHRVAMDEDAAAHLATISDGDARKCLNALEVGVLTTAPGADGSIHFTRAVAEESIQRKAVVYDPTGDGHYDTISAFIKSMRGSDPDAAVYWLAKMLYAGEDIRFIARRLVICAAEDIGLADSQALVVAVAAQQAAEFVGLPEAQIPLAQATVYLATAPKSNRSYAALSKASADVREGVTLPVPVYLRGTGYTGAKRLGHGHEYQYSHDSPDAYVPQAYLPEGRRYYEPSDRGSEKRIAERLAHWRALFEEARAREDPLREPSLHQPQDERVTVHLAIARRQAGNDNQDEVRNVQADHHRKSDQHEAEDPGDGHIDREADLRVHGLLAVFIEEGGTILAHQPDHEWRNGVGKREHVTRERAQVNEHRPCPIVLCREDRGVETGEGIHAAKYLVDPAKRNLIANAPPVPLSVMASDDDSRRLP